LLRIGDRKLFEVAKLVGYDSDAAFSKAGRRRRAASRDGEERLIEIICPQKGAGGNDSLKEKQAVLCFLPLQEKGIRTIPSNYDFGARNCGNSLLVEAVL
jgi:hypothetical protein